MGTQPAYNPINPVGPTSTRTLEPFRFTIDKEKFELPALDSANVPLALLPIFLALGSGQVDNEEDKVRVAGTFVAFIQDEHPRLWRALRRQKEPIRWVLGLIEQWGDHSKMDPQLPPSGV